MSQLLNSAGFEVARRLDLTRRDMVRVVPDFSAKVAERGPSAVAMVYYAGHGVQVAGEVVCFRSMRRSLHRLISTTTRSGWST